MRTLTPSSSKLLSIQDCFFIKPGPLFQHDGDLFAIPDCIDEGINDFGIASQPVAGDFNGGTSGSMAASLNMSVTGLKE